MKLIVCANIKKHRQLKKWSQKDLAKAVNFTQAFISNIEAGKRSPSLEAIEKISKALEINPATLLMPIDE